MRTLRLGSTGEDVQVWQAFLRSLGLYAGRVDGSFGPHTEEATRAFQTANKLVSDGTVGSKTFGVAMQLGLDLAPEDPPLVGGPREGVSSLNDAWQPAAPPLDAS